MNAIKTDDIDHDRRRFVGGAAMAVAAAQLGGSLARNWDEQSRGAQQAEKIMPSDQARNTTRPLRR